MRLKNGIRTESLFFVPHGHNCEIHRIRITNNSGKIPFIEFCLWNALDDQTNFQRNLNTGEVEADGGTIYHLTEYRECRNHLAFYSINRQPDVFDTDKDFLSE